MIEATPSHDQRDVVVSSADRAVNFIDPHWGHINPATIEFPMCVITGWELIVNGEIAHVQQSMVLKDRSHFMQMFNEWRAK